VYGKKCTNSKEGGNNPPASGREGRTHNQEEKLKNGTKEGMQTYKRAQNSGEEPDIPRWHKPPEKGWETRSFSTINRKRQKTAKKRHKKSK